MKQFNQRNKSQVIDVSDDTVAFMMANGFSTDGNWYQWYKNRHQQSKPATTKEQ